MTGTGTRPPVPTGDGGPFVGQNGGEMTGTGTRPPRPPDPAPCPYRRRGPMRKSLSGQYRLCAQGIDKYSGPINVGITYSDGMDVEQIAVLSSLIVVPVGVGIVVDGESEGYSDMKLGC